MDGPERDAGVAPGHDAALDSAMTRDACAPLVLHASTETIDGATDAPGNILIVFDQSASMNEAWNGTTKIQAAVDAISSGVASVQDKVNAGAIFFPHVDPKAASGCNWSADWINCLLSVPSSQLCLDVDAIGTAPQIPIQPGASFVGAWKAYWTPPLAAKGAGTPTEKGMLAAEAALEAPPEGNTAVVLVTDGAPTCGANEQAPAERLLALGIKTYVIGLPGAAGTTVLDNVAIAGGKAPAGCTSHCFISPNDGAALQKAFSEIATDVGGSKAALDCTFTLIPPANPKPEDLHLIVTESSSSTRYDVPQSASNGFSLSADCRSATLTGSLCANGKRGAYSSFSFEYGCVAAPPLPAR